MQTPDDEFPEFIDEVEEFPELLLSEEEMNEVICEALSEPARKAAESLERLADAAMQMSEHFGRMKDDYILSSEAVD